MADKEVLLTEEGLKKLQDRLTYLKEVKRLEVADRLKAAIALGDLSENSEYDDAKNEQAFMEGEIKELEEMVKHVTIISNEGPSDIVRLGSTIKLKDIEFDEIEEYQIVGSSEADPENGKLSNECPVGAAVIGKRAGDVVQVDVGENIIEYMIMEIEH